MPKIALVSVECVCMVETYDISTLEDILTPARQAVAEGLDKWLVEDGTPDSLADALRYCTEGGKRLRAGLVFLSAEVCGGDVSSEFVRRAAVAIELIHAYSLVHDDLPAMDDDTLRRGRATAHVKFGPAMAILAGDALLTCWLSLARPMPANLRWCWLEQLGLRA